MFISRTQHNLGYRQRNMANVQRSARLLTLSEHRKLTETWCWPGYRIHSQPRIVPSFTLQSETESQRHKKTYRINWSLPSLMPDYFFLTDLVSSPVLNVPKAWPSMLLLLTLSSLRSSHHSSDPTKSWHNVPSVVYPHINKSQFSQLLGTSSTFWGKSAKDYRTTMH